MKICSALFCSTFALLLTALPSSAAGCSSVAGNLIVNCGFELGSFAGWTLSGNDTPGQLNNLYGVEGVDPIDSVAPNSGSYQAYVADLPSNALTLAQKVTTLAERTYTITFYLAQDTTPTAQYGNSLAVLFDGVSLTSQTDVPVEGYTEYSFYGSTVGPVTTLDITLGNSLGEFLLDDVSVTLDPLPEPRTWAMAMGGGLLLGSARMLRTRKKAA